MSDFIKLNGYNVKDINALRLHHVIPENTDMDTLIETGIYSTGLGTGITNLPPVSNIEYAFVIVLAEDNECHQYYIKPLNNQIFIREYSGNPLVWSDWKESSSNNVVKTDGFIPENTDLDTLIQTGIYSTGSASGLTNLPDVAYPEFAFIYVYNVKDEIHQFYFKPISNEAFMRELSGNPLVWSDWNRLSNDPVESSSLTLDSSYFDPTEVDVNIVRKIGHIVVINFRGKLSQAIVANTPGAIAVPYDSISGEFGTLMYSDDEYDSTNATEDWFFIGTGYLTPNDIPSGKWVHIHHVYVTND